MNETDDNTNFEYSLDPVSYTDYLNTFEVHKHKVVMLSARIMRVTIKTPFPPSMNPTLDERLFVMGEVERVIKYLKLEGFIEKEQIHIIVLTEPL